MVEIRGKDMSISLIIKLTRTNFCYSKRCLSCLNILYVQNMLEVLCIYLMEDIVWNGSYSDCTVLTVTLSVGIGHGLFNRTRISHLNMYMPVPLPAQYSTLHRCTVCFIHPTLCLLRHIFGLESNDARI